MSLSGLIGTETSEYEMPISDKFYLEQFNDVISDYTVGGNFDALNTYGFDTTDATLWRVHEIDFEEVYQSSSFDTAKLDLAYDVSGSLTVKTGASFQKFENDQRRARSDNNLRSDFEDGVDDDDITSVARVFSDHDDQAWTIVDFNAALGQFGAVRDPSTFDDGLFDVAVEEETTAAYVQADWESMLGELPFRGNVGARYYSIDPTTQDVLNELSTEASYDGFLPSINAAIEVTDNIVLRAAYSQNINRLGLGTLAPVIYSVGEEGGDVTVSQAPDPSLDPFTSDNFDLSAEWYFDEVGVVAIGVFHKTIPMKKSSNIPILRPDAFIMSRRAARRSSLAPICNSSGVVQSILPQQTC